MTIEHEPRTRIVLSWLREDAHENAERVLLRALDEVDATPQRRSWWPARRFSMPTYARFIAAAAALVIVALVGYQVVPGAGGKPTVTPSPSPAVLAQGTFVVQRTFTTTLDATSSGSNASGTMRAESNDSGAFTVNLQCKRPIERLLWIGGDVTESSYASAPKGTRAAIVFNPAAPVEAVFIFQGNDPRSASCLAFFDDMLALLDTSGDDIHNALAPIQGTLTLNPGMADLSPAASTGASPAAP